MLLNKIFSNFCLSHLPTPFLSLVSELCYSKNSISLLTRTRRVGRLKGNSYSLCMGGNELEKEESTSNKGGCCGTKIFSMVLTPFLRKENMRKILRLNLDFSVQNFWSPIMKSTTLGLLIAQILFCGG